MEFLYEEAGATASALVEAVKQCEERDRSKPSPHRFARYVALSSSEQLHTGPWRFDFRAQNWLEAHRRTRAILPPVAEGVRIGTEFTIRSSAGSSVTIEKIRGRNLFLSSEPGCPATMMETAPLVHYSRLSRNYPPVFFWKTEKHPTELSREACARACLALNPGAASGGGTCYFSFTGVFPYIMDYSYYTPFSLPSEVDISTAIAGELYFECSSRFGRQFDCVAFGSN